MCRTSNMPTHGNVVDHVPVLTTTALHQCRATRRLELASRAAAQEMPGLGRPAENQHPHEEGKHLWLYGVLCSQKFVRASPGRRRDLHRCSLQVRKCDLASGPPVRANVCVQRRRQASAATQCWTKPLRGERQGVEPDSKCNLVPSSEGLFQTNEEVTPRWKHCLKRNSSRTTRGTCST